MNDDVLNNDKVKENIKLSCFFYQIAKRFFDIIIGTIGIICLIPITIIVKIVSICSGDRDSIFFKQERIGKDGTLFKMYKFRTMVLGADHILEQLLTNNEEMRKEYSLNKKLKNDPRITVIGKILRKTSLDEFPQFINVFLGDMSLIGNRPYLPREKEDMGDAYDAIVSTKPGISGLWQVSGRSNITFNERLKIEENYSKIASFKLDVKIFFKTIIQVLKKDGAE